MSATAEYSTGGNFEGGRGKVQNGGVSSRGRLNGFAGAMAPRRAPAPPPEPSRLCACSLSSPLGCSRRAAADGFRSGVNVDRYSVICTLTTVGDGARQLSEHQERLDTVASIHGRGKAPFPGCCPGGGARTIRSSDGSD